MQETRTRKRMQGFTLVEVLIALIIMSVGMLGIAGLYMHSMHAGRTSVLRHHAVNLAGDVADRIRANPAAGALYQTSTATNNSCVDGGVDCDATEMAENDMFIWNAQAADVLPGGTVAVTFTANTLPTPSTYQITVAWTEAGQSPPPQYQIVIPVTAFAP